MNDSVSNTGNNISKIMLLCASIHIENHILLYSQSTINFIKDEIKILNEAIFFEINFFIDLYKYYKSHNKK